MRASRRSLNLVLECLGAMTRGGPWSGSWKISRINLLPRYIFSRVKLTLAGFPYLCAITLSCTYHGPPIAECLSSTDGKTSNYR